MLLPIDSQEKPGQIIINLSCLKKGPQKSGVTLDLKFDHSFYHTEFLIWDLKFGH